jgi:hypothetical protein
VVAAAVGEFSFLVLTTAPAVFGASLVPWVAGSDLLLLGLHLPTFAVMFLAGACGPLLLVLSIALLLWPSLLRFLPPALLLAASESQAGVLPRLITVSFFAGPALTTLSYGWYLWRYRRAPLTQLLAPRRLTPKRVHHLRLEWTRWRRGRSAYQPLLDELLKRAAWQRGLPYRPPSIALWRFFFGGLFDPTLLDVAQRLVAERRPVTAELLRDEEALFVRVLDRHLDAFDDRQRYEQTVTVEAQPPPPLPPPAEPEPPPLRPLEQLARIAAARAAQFSLGSPAARKWLRVKDLALSNATLQQVREALGEEFNDDIRRTLREAGIRMD